ncbi:uncharacterized protein MONBRDRAFT_35950 [Monosiga brevicollis MX1]|uniref:Uncharacterized protein n=1 Tax=Monosiga brevicollis TaxID=81824 RepID=A9UST3_MONBE|nr:uncharacterized protein MONBRDRAFT_35950 [Monosiga brevicollis MX1]EDQ92158.1 predicted protein [Monosiga brevicollis MX1]|eukprot:XP_001743444.1 hypothetical protein [Monosiga brevicollis MX1]
MANDRLPLSASKQRIFERRMTRSTAIAVAMIVCGAVLLGSAAVQGAVTKMTKAHSVHIGTTGAQPFTLLVWGSADLHAGAVVTMFMSVFTAVASLIAIIAFQDYSKHATFQINLTETLGWIIIGATALVTIGVASAADLDSRAIMGTHFTGKRAASMRVATMCQMGFSLAVLLLTLPLPFTMQDVDALAVTAMVASFLAAFLGFFASIRSARHVNCKTWSSDVDTLRFERAWGLSVGCHCLCLLASGLHAYFSAQIIADCLRDDTAPGYFRPSCDGDVGVLAGILPHLVNTIAVLALGVTSIIASVRIAIVTEILLDDDENIPDAITLHSVRLRQP